MFARVEALLTSSATSCSTIADDPSALRPLEPLHVKIGCLEASVYDVPELSRSPRLLTNWPWKLRRTRGHALLSFSQSLALNYAQRSGRSQDDIYQHSLVRFCFPYVSKQHGNRCRRYSVRSLASHFRTAISADAFPFVPQLLWSGRCSHPRARGHYLRICRSILAVLSLLDSPRRPRRVASLPAGCSRRLKGGRGVRYRRTVADPRLVLPGRPTAPRLHSAREEAAEGGSGGIGAAWRRRWPPYISRNK